MAKIVLDKTAAKKLEQVPLSNDTIRSRIADMSADILEQVVEDLKMSPAKFSLQLDESTDVANCCQLLVFVRYLKGNMIKEEFLFCEPLHTTKKAADVFAMLEAFFVAHEITWAMVGSGCTDGAPAMLGNRSGFATLVKAVAPHISTLHCMIHRQTLAANSLPPPLSAVLSTVVKAVNFIRGRPLNHRLFGALCDEIGAEHTVLLYHTEVRWLSKGKVLSRVFELFEEIHQFLRNQGSPLADAFDKPQFRLSVAYLADVFALLNELNLSLQGRDMNILRAQEKLNAFLSKLGLWSRRVAAGNFANFSNLDGALLGDKEIGHLGENIQSHLDMLSASFDRYFSPAATKNTDAGWIQHPFAFPLDGMDDTHAGKEELIELKSGEVFRRLFENASSVANFWCSQREGFPVLASLALDACIPFVSTYLCEIGFSTLLQIKTKSRNRLDASSDMRLALSGTKPRIDRLVESRQQQPSH